MQYWPLDVISYLFFMFYFFLKSACNQFKICKCSETYYKTEFLRGTQFIACIHHAFPSKLKGFHPSGWSLKIYTEVYSWWLSAHPEDFMPPISEIEINWWNKWGEWVINSAFTVLQRKTDISFQNYIIWYGKYCSCLTLLLSPCKLKIACSMTINLPFIFNCKRTYHFSC